MHRNSTWSSAVKKQIPLTSSAAKVSSINRKSLDSSYTNDIISHLADSLLAVGSGGVCAGLVSLGWQPGQTCVSIQLYLSASRSPCNHVLSLADRASHFVGRGEFRGIGAIGSGVLLDADRGVSAMVYVDISPLPECLLLPFAAGYIAG